MRGSIRFAGLSAIAALLVLSGCAKKPVTATPSAGDTARESVESADSRAGTGVRSDDVQPIRESVPDSVNIGADPNAPGAGGATPELKTVYFDYDSSNLSDAEVSILQANAAWLKANSRVSVEIGGHCDDRGTINYNLALGDRRAGAVRDYLVTLGIPASRLKTVSYGEERPAVPGTDDAARAKNRRAEFSVVR